jgi:outer membrane receptor protein involved in Fe transport
MKTRFARINQRAVAANRSCVNAAGKACVAVALTLGCAVTAAAPNNEALEVVVTAKRLPSSRLDFPGSLTRLDGDSLAFTGATHHSESLNRIPGVYVQRGSGQESLPAIRSPVLTGPGSCGAFLVLEDGLPLRPVGFCNVNELFELNYEQAGAIEVVRGPGPAVYGANALHGIVNVISPDPGELPPFGFAIEGGSDDYQRVSFRSGTDAIGEGAGVYGIFTRDNGFRAESGFDEAKLNLLADTQLASGTLRLRASGTVLNQETAGFVIGEDAYRDPALRLSNPNPEAYRDAWSTRLAAHWSREPCTGCSDSIAAVLRRSEMDFLQHFLLGKPVEHNEQTSLGVSAAIQRPLRDDLTFHTGVDAEVSDTDLLESQQGPTLDGAPAARAIRPAGRHYDYNVKARTAGAFGALDWRFAPRWRLGAALRLEQTQYDYDNLMIAGNTDENGVACGAGGCLYSRPEDRDDRFSNVAPKIDVTYELTENQRLYLASARGFRPPEMTELYRLQRQQTFADLDSERVDSVELGWMGGDERIGWTLAAYTLEKRDVILRDANAFNVSDGRTSHRGLEYELHVRPLDWMRVDAAGTVAWHRYDFSQAVEGGETITEGKDIDTAPRNAHHLAVGVQPFARTTAELELLHVSEYFVDASNEHRYPGHTLVNTRVSYELAPNWQTTLRVTNVFDRRYADRADFAFGNYRYFPGRDRSWFLEIAYAGR